MEVQLAICNVVIIAGATKFWIARAYVAEPIQGGSEVRVTLLLAPRDCLDLCLDRPPISIAIKSGARGRSLSGRWSTLQGRCRDVAAVTGTAVPSDVRAGSNGDFIWARVVQAAASVLLGANREEVNI